MVPVSVSIQHGLIIFVRAVEEQEHITSRIDGQRKHFRTFHTVGHADHMGSVCDNHSVEAQLLAEQAFHDFGLRVAGIYHRLSDPD